MSAACDIEQLGRKRPSQPRPIPQALSCKHANASPLCKGAKRFKRDKYADIDLNHRQYTSCTPGAAGSAFYYHAFLFLLYYIIDIAIEAKV